jgi:hypothetical protein
VDIRLPEPEATLPKKECAAILNMVVKCVWLPECNAGRIFDNFAIAAQRYFNRLEEMPVFTSRNFYTVCTTVCTRKSYGDLEQYAALAERAVAALVPRWAPDRGPL